MDAESSLVIVGGGNAASELAVQARQGGWAGAITMVGNEPVLPYHRPPLSKAYLKAQADMDSLSIRPTAAYERAGVIWRGETTVTAIDRAARQVHLSDGGMLPYQRLALCTGGRPRRWSPPGLPEDARPSNLLSLRTLADADALRAALRPGVRLVIIGAGYVGLEVAASAVALGAQVTVLEALPRVLARSTSEVLSRFYESEHRTHGVDLRTGATVQHVERAGPEISAAITALQIRGGGLVPADVVLAGIGMLPNAELATAAGLEVEGGIVVDELSRTSDPEIVSAGDCTVQRDAATGRLLRLESVPNALEQARAAASGLCGKPRPNRSVPWFWSDQYQLKLQMVGLAAGHDRFVCRGTLSADGFIAFYLREGVLIAAEAVNRAPEFMLAKRLVAAAVRPDPQRLADAATPLKDLLPVLPAPAS